MNASFSFVVLRAGDGSVDVLGVDDLDTGVWLKDPRKLTVSGSGTVQPPKRSMTAIEFEAWLAQLRSERFQVSEGSMES